MTVAEAPTRARRRKAATRARLLRAAAELYAEVGVEAVTVAAITERADAGAGTFYLHFRDKEAIAEAVGGDLVARVGRAMDRAVSQTMAAAGDPLAAHRAATRAVCEVAASEARVLDALYRWRGPGSGPGLRQALVERMAAGLAWAMEVGALRRQDPHLAAHAVLGLYAESILYWASAGRRDWDTLADFLERTSLAGLS